MWDCGFVGNGSYFETGSLKSADRGLTARTGPGNVDVHLPHAVFLGRSACLLCRDLGRKRRSLTASLEVDQSGRSPADSVALDICDRDQRVVERGVNVRHSNWNVFLFLCFASNDFSCHGNFSVTLLLLLGLLLAGNRLRLALAATGIASGSLAAGRKAPSVPQSPVAVDLDQAANV